MARNTDRGILYVATKDQRFAAEALLSAASVKELVPDMHITLFTDMVDSIFVKEDCFDAIVPIESVKNFRNQWSEGTRDRMLCLAESPYELTLNLDTDTRVMSAEIADLFDVLEEHDIALAECRTDNSFSCQKYGSRMFNVGVMLYRKFDKTLALFKAWSELTAQHFAAASRPQLPDIDYLAHVTDEAIRRRLLFIDQVAFVRLLSPETNVLDLRLKILDESWNFRGSAEGRLPDEPLKVSHDPQLRQVLVRDLIAIAIRHQQAGDTQRALEFYRFFEERMPDNQEIKQLIAKCVTSHP